MSPRAVHLRGRRRVYDGHLKLDELTLTFERLDGAMNRPVTRLVLERGDSAAVLLHDPKRGRVMLTRQLRPATLSSGDGWLIEAMAGSIEPGETPERALRRELKEEIGVVVNALTPIATVYPSPGGASERVFLFYAAYGEGSVVDASARGAAGEDEDVERVEMPVRTLLERLEAGALQDAKLVIAAQWLALRAARRRPGPRLPLGPTP